MSREFALLSLAGGLGVGAFVTFRFSIRGEVLRALNTDYQYDQQIATEPLYRLGAQVLNIPSASELAESLVPIWSFVMPEQALQDVLAKGRESAFWPAARRESKAPKIVDKTIFAVLERLYYAQTSGQIAQK
jgi:hypothetical protein